MFWHRQATCYCDAEDLERRGPCDSWNWRRRLRDTFAPVVSENNFICLRTIQLQIVGTWPFLYVVLVTSRLGGAARSLNTALDVSYISYRYVLFAEVWNSPEMALKVTRGHRYWLCLIDHMWSTSNQQSVSWCDDVTWSLFIKTVAAAGCVSDVTLSSGAHWCAAHRPVAPAYRP